MHLMYHSSIWNSCQTSRVISDWLREFGELVCLEKVVVDTGKRLQNLRVQSRCHPLNNLQHFAYDEQETTWHLVIKYATTALAKHNRTPEHKNWGKYYLGRVSLKENIKSEHYWAWIGTWHGSHSREDQETIRSAWTELDDAQHSPHRSISEVAAGEQQKLKWKVSSLWSVHWLVAGRWPADGFRRSV